MRLAGTDGAAVELELVGYAQDEPPVGEENEWLDVRLSVAGAGEPWTAEEPALTTGEVLGLAAWLEAVARGRPDDLELDFLEPNLRFELVSEDEERVVLRVWLEHWPTDEQWLDLDVDRAQVASAAEALRAEIETFPARLAWGDEG